MALLKALADAASGLQVDPSRMRENIERMQGLVHAEALAMKLAVTLGKASAHAVVQAWSQKVVKERSHLRDTALAALVNDPVLASAATRDEIAGLFDADVARDRGPPRSAPPARRRYARGGASRQAAKERLR